MTTQDKFKVFLERTKQVAKTGEKKLSGTTTEHVCRVFAANTGIPSNDVTSNVSGANNSSGSAIATMKVRLSVYSSTPYSRS